MGAPPEEGGPRLIRVLRVPEWALSRAGLRPGGLALLEARPGEIRIRPVRVGGLRLGRQVSPGEVEECIAAGARR